MSGPIAAVLVAAGQSRRMAFGDKLWIELWGRPVWRWALDTLLAVPGMAHIAVVVPPLALERFEAALPEAARDRCHVVAGGADRVDSVVAGIAVLTALGLPEEITVLVHDAARPAASAELMTRVADALQPGEGVIPVVALQDALKKIDASGRVVAPIDRESVSAAQTPQAASLGALRAAIEESMAWGRKASDEAEALAAGGLVVRAIPGEAGNRKLTEPGDEALLRGVLAASVLPLSVTSAAGDRTGIGFDAHRFDPNADRQLHLGGIVIKEEPGLAGHSDGDVALHAVIDALLGGAGLGDIGSLYPAEDEKWRDADSSELLRGVMESLAEAGWRPSGIDLAIVAQRPSIATHRDQIVERLAALCGLSTAAVSVKGTTSDGLGFTGTEGIAAYAVATLGRT
jgi:2-C-methyl-D-erythritol 4-phosphate cytidylyltransferase/2-C-methyl-D-erythritol 2,4-cyclodiphosphate synthase